MISRAYHSLRAERSPLNLLGSQIGSTVSSWNGTCHMERKGSRMQEGVATVDIMVAFWDAEKRQLG